jgi:ribosomal protein S18 acetylase RimI-like enzyme
VADVDACPRGLIRAVYDGSRALIHLLSVEPGFQRKGIGSALVRAMEQQLRMRGAPSVSVTVTASSAGFWRKHGFNDLPAFLMLKPEI